MAADTQDADLPDQPKAPAAGAGSDATIDAVLSELQASGWLDDRRAVESLLAGKAARFGVRRLAQTLRQRELPDELITEALQDLRASEGRRALDVWRRRFGVPPRNAQERARQQRFLAGRGFAAESIEQVFRALQTEGEDSGLPTDG